MHTTALTNKILSALYAHPSPCQLRVENTVAQVTSLKWIRHALLLRELQKSVLEVLTPLDWLQHQSWITHSVRL